MIKIILADDHQMFLDGMKSFLKQAPDIYIVGEAVNGREVMEILKNEPVDVVVLDVEMPEMDGIETTRQIKKDFQQTKVLILTMFNRKGFIVKLMEEGASGYILKNKSKEELTMAIRNVYEGRPHFGLEVLDKATTVPSNLDKKVHLTGREIDVLRLIAEAKTTKEIASILYISEPTVNTHRRNLLRKLGFDNSSHLVRYAIKHGYVSLDEET